MAAISSRPVRLLRRGEHPSGLRLHDRVAGSETSSVHLGWLEEPARVVAVKRLHPLHDADEVAVARVFAEARLAMRIVHPNVVATLGLVRRPGELLAVMDYVAGASLAEICAALAGGLEPRLARGIAAGALRGLHAAHEVRGRGSPREVSARRVLVAEDGSARILDFDAQTPTTPDATIANLPYAAPEELGPQRLDVRRDIYAASVLLWETLTGRALFRAATVKDTVWRILAEPVSAPSRFVPAIGPELDAIVLRGLARDPSDRFASANAMANELERAECAPLDEVARAVAAMDLAGVRRRRLLAESVRRTEEALCTSSAARGI